MWVWWFLIVCVPLFGALSEQQGKLIYSASGEGRHQPNALLYSVACGLLIFFAGLRSTTGDGVLSIGDTRVYTGLFRTLVKDNILDFFRLTDLSGDWGFYALMTLFRQFFRVDAQGLFFICSFITICALFYRYYTLNLPYVGLRFFLFISLGSYVTAMNGVRQYLVSSILFLAFPLIKGKHWKQYFIIVIILSTMHNSALVFLLLYFIADKPAWGKVMKGMIWATLLLLVTYPITGQFISFLLSGSNYSQYSETILSSGGGANILRIAVYVAPILLAFRYRRLIEGEPYYNIITNFSVLDTLFMILAATNWIYARFCIYLTPFWLIQFTWVLKYAFTKESKRLALYICIILCSIYFWYEMYIAYGGQIYTSTILGIGI